MHSVCIPNQHVSRNNVLSSSRIIHIKSVTVQLQFPESVYVLLSDLLLPDRIHIYCWKSVKLAMNNAYAYYSFNIEPDLHIMHAFRSPGRVDCRFKVSCASENLIEWNYSNFANIVCQRSQTDPTTAGMCVSEFATNALPDSDRSVTTYWYIHRIEDFHCATKWDLNSIYFKSKQFRERNYKQLNRNRGYNLAVIYVL